jgi:hypothetical protein
MRSSSTPPIAPQGDFALPFGSVSVLQGKKRRMQPITPGDASYVAYATYANDDSSFAE